MKKDKQRAEAIDSLVEQGYRYITRSQHGEVVAHKTKPKRQINYWESNNKAKPIVNIDTFGFVQWDDSPYDLRKGNR